MKKYWKYFIIFLLLNSNCKKEDTSFIDVRDYYSGKFEFDYNFVYGVVDNVYIEDLRNWPVTYKGGYSVNNRTSGYINFYENDLIDICYDGKGEYVKDKNLFIGLGRITPTLDFKNDTLVLYSASYNKISFYESYSIGEKKFYCSGRFVSMDTVAFTCTTTISKYDSVFKPQITCYTQVDGTVPEICDTTYVLNITHTVTTINERAFGYRIK